MGGKWQVVVSGGHDNLYLVSETGGDFYVYKESIGLIFNDKKQIGKTNSLKLALTLIEHHSGDDIEKVKEV